MDVIIGKIILIKPCENFLDQYQFKNFKDTILYKSFPWFTTEIILEENFDKYNFLADPKYNFQLTHLFYIKGIPCSEFFHLLQPFTEKLNMDALISAKINLNPCTDTIVEHSYHVDNTINNCTTAVFYLNTNNGYTTFETGDKFFSKENTLVKFPTHIKHSGSTCTDEKYRLVMNINYIAGN